MSFSLLSENGQLNNVLMGRGGVEYIFLGSQFFNDKAYVSKQRLEELANRSLQLENPYVYGRFLSNSHYLKTLEILLESTLETEHRYEFFERVVLPKVKRFSNMLDIGPGTGEMTEILGIKFKKVTVVDTSQEALSMLEGRDLSKNTNLETINENVLDLFLPKKRFDLAIISHVLYYLDRSLWPGVIAKVFNSLAPGGVLVAVINGGLGKGRLIQTFGGKELGIDDLVKACKMNLEATVEVFVSNELYYSLGIKPMMHIAGLHLYDAETVATQEELYRYLMENNACDGGKYKMSVYQKFLVLRKNSV